MSSIRDCRGPPHHRHMTAATSISASRSSTGQLQDPVQVPLLDLLILTGGHCVSSIVLVFLDWRW
jgi:hypothetical protein